MAKACVSRSSSPRIVSPQSPCPHPETARGSRGWWGNSMFLLPQGQALPKKDERGITGAQGRIGKAEGAGFPVSSSSWAPGHLLNTPPLGWEEGPRTSRAGRRGAGLRGVGSAPDLSGCSSPGEAGHLRGHCCSSLLQLEPHRGALPDCPVLLLLWPGGRHHAGKALLRGR